MGQRKDPFAVNLGVIFDLVNVPSAAFLLLALFVGHGVDERGLVSARKDVVAEHYRQQEDRPKLQEALCDQAVILEALGEFGAVERGEGGGGGA